MDISLAMNMHNVEMAMRNHLFVWLYMLLCGHTLYIVSALLADFPLDYIYIRQNRNAQWRVRFVYIVIIILGRCNVRYSWAASAIKRGAQKFNILETAWISSNMGSFKYATHRVCACFSLCVCVAVVLLRLQIVVVCVGF